MAKYQPSNRRNPCRICGNIKGDCRSVEDNILCHGYRDLDAGVAGWKYLRPSQNRLWGVYVPDDDRSGKSWQDVIEERNQRRQREEEERQARRKDGNWRTAVR